MPAARQLDLLNDWTPPEVVERFDAVTVRAATVEGRISKAVAAVLKNRDRTAIAKAMGAYLGLEISKNMLDAYASEARDDHVIPVARLMALLEVTRDRRLLQVLADQCGWMVVEDRHIHLIALAEVREQQANLERQADALRRMARR